MLVVREVQEDQTKNLKTEERNLRQQTTEKRVDPYKVMRPQTYILRFKSMSEWHGFDKP